MEDKYLNRTKRSNPGRKALTIAGGVFLVFYLILGILFLTIPKLPFDMDPSVRKTFGIILIVYACVRLWRVVKNLRDKDITE